MQEKISRPVFWTYWVGYRDDVGTPTPLTSIPDYVEEVILGFGQPKPDSTLSLDFMRGQFSLADIKEGIQFLHKRGQQVRLSLGDLPTLVWADVDLTKFIDSVKTFAIDEMDMDGFDINAEGSSTIETFKELTRRLSEIKVPHKNMSITYTTAGSCTDELQGIAPYVKAIQLMNYELSAESYLSYAHTVAAMESIGTMKVVIGVKNRIKGYTEGTPIDTVKALCQSIQAQNFLGIFHWSADMDNPSFSENPNCFWMETIRDNLWALEMQVSMAATSAVAEVIVNPSKVGIFSIVAPQNQGETQQTSSRCILS